MTVNPGYGGQRCIPSSLDKVRRARALLDAAGSGASLQVDGGIDRTTIGEVHVAGADAFVAGNAIFSAADPKGEIGELRARCGAAARARRAVHVRSARAERPPAR